MPDSRGQWLLTGSRATISLKNAYERFIMEPDARDLFIEVCTQASPQAAMIRKHTLILGNFAAIEENGSIQARRSGDEYSLVELYGYKRVRYQAVGNHFANVLINNDGLRLLLNSTQNPGRVTITQEFGYRSVIYDSPYETVLREINIERQHGMSRWDGASSLPVVFSVDSRTGVRVGVLNNIDRKNTRWSLAGGNLHLDYWPVLEKDMRAQLVGLELVNQALWPMMVSDTYAADLLNSRK